MRCQRHNETLEWRRTLFACGDVAASRSSRSMQSDIATPCRQRGPARSKKMCVRAPDRKMQQWEKLVIVRGAPPPKRQASPRALKDAAGKPPLAGLIAGTLIFVAIDAPSARFLWTIMAYELPLRASKASVQLTSRLIYRWSTIIRTKGAQYWPEPEP